MDLKKKQLECQVDTSPVSKIPVSQQGKISVYNLQNRLQRFLSSNYLIRPVYPNLIFLQTSRNKITDREIV